MNTRKRLITDIDIFIVESIKRHNKENLVDVIKYENLINLTTSLKVNDFENPESYNQYLGYMNQPLRQMNLMWVKNSFEENYLESSAFLYLMNDFQGISNWLK